MALGDLRRKIKSGQSLVETSQEEVQKLAQQRGMAAPSITPIGTSLMTGTPDQAKMAGTPAQTQAAFKMAAPKPEQTISTTERRLTGEREVTESETQAKEKAQRLSQLGSLGSRITDLVVGQFQKAGTAAPITATVSTTPIEGVATEQQDQAKNLLQQYASTPDLATQANLRQELANLGVNLTPDTIGTLFQQAGTQISSVAAEQIANSLPMTEETLSSLGYATPESQIQLAADLGLAPEVLKQMSVTELNDLVTQTQQAEFTKVQDLKTRAINPLVGPAEREQAMRELRELGATGVFATEAEMQRLSQEIESADEIEFAGKAYKVDELLKDDVITGVVSEYLAAKAAGDTTQIDALKSSSPDFAAWIDTNQNALQEALVNVENATQALDEIRSTNQKITQIGGNVTSLNDDVMKLIYPDSWGKFTTQKFTSEDSNLLKALETYGPELAEKFAVQLNSFAQSDPEFVKELATLSPDEIKQLGIAEDSNTWNAYKTYSDKVKKYKSINPNNKEALLDFLLGENFMDVSDVEALKQYGYSGKVDNILNQLRSTSEFVQNPDKSLKDILKSGIPKVSPSTNLPETLKKELNKLKDLSQHADKGGDPKLLDTVEDVDSLYRSIPEANADKLVKGLDLSPALRERIKAIKQVKEISRVRNAEDSVLAKLRALPEEFGTKGITSLEQAGTAGMALERLLQTTKDPYEQQTLRKLLSKLPKPVPGSNQYQTTALENVTSDKTPKIRVDSSVVGEY